MSSSSTGTAGFDSRGRADLGLRGHLDGLHVGAGREHGLAGEQLEQHDAAAVDVHAVVGLEAQRDLGRQVAQLALDGAHVGLGRSPLGAGDAEVDELHVAGVGDHHVLRGHVAVDDAQRLAAVVPLLVGVVEALADLGDDVDRVLDGDRAMTACIDLLEEAVERPPVHELHDDVVGVVLQAELVDLGDVGVRERDGDLGLVHQHVHEARVERVLREDLLDRDLLLEAGDAVRARRVDLGHATGGHAPQQRVPPSFLPAPSWRSSPVELTVARGLAADLWGAVSATRSAGHHRRGPRAWQAGPCRAPRRCW
jgi:hypothetical protein